MTIFCQKSECTLLNEILKEMSKKLIKKSISIFESNPTRHEIDYIQEKLIWEHNFFLFFTFFTANLHLKNVKIISISFFDSISIHENVHKNRISLVRIEQKSALLLYFEFVPKFVELVFSTCISWKKKEKKYQKLYFWKIHIY